jgi:CRISPR-associated protein Cas5d
MTYCLEVTGDYACFTRPEMKVERVSYDVITPSAARAIFEAILWKPAIRWQVTKIEVLKPIRWASVRRNEVAAVISSDSVKTAMNRGEGNLGLYVEDERQQRASLLLRDVAYRLHARFELLDPTRHRSRYPHLIGALEDAQEREAMRGPETPQKYAAMFQRRARKGQCFNQPYLGTREFACAFRLVEDGGTAPAPIAETRDLGWMLYDLDYTLPESPKPLFYRAEMKGGVIAVPDRDSEEVRG